MRHYCLLKLGACNDGFRYAARFKTLQSAWDHCTNQGWMLWAISVSPKGHARLVKIALEAVKESVDDKKPLPRDTVIFKAVQDWLRGKMSLWDLGSRFHATFCDFDNTAALKTLMLLIIAHSRENGVAYAAHVLDRSIKTEKQVAFIRKHSPKCPIKE